MDDRPPQDGMWRRLYGSADGRWYVLTGPSDATPPDTVGALRCLGDPNTVVCAVWRRVGKQAIVAAYLHVNQQTVSRYILGSARPELSPEGWRQLAILALTPAGGDAESSCPVAV